MGIDSVTNYALYQSTIKDITKVSADLAAQQMQLSSGNAAQDFSEMAGQVQQYLSLEGSISRVDQYISNNKIILTRIEGTANALGQMIETSSSFQSVKTASGGKNLRFFSPLTNIFEQFFFSQ